MTSRPCERGTYGVESTSASPRPLPSRTSHGPVVGPNSRARLARSAAASCRTVVMPRAASLATVFWPIPQIASGGRSPRAANHVAVVRRPDSRGLAEPRRDLGLQLVVADADRAVQAVAALTSAARPRAKPSGSSVSTPTNASSQPSTSTGAPGLPQHGHHPVRDLVVGVGVHGQEHAVRAALRRGTQRQARVHAELARLVGGGGDDAALRRVAVPADHDRLAPQLGVTQLLDRREKLVHVHVQHPLGHAVGPTQPGPVMISGAGKPHPFG